MFDGACQRRTRTNRRDDSSEKTVAGIRNYLAREQHSQFEPSRQRQAANDAVYRKSRNRENKRCTCGGQATAEGEQI